MNIKQLKNILFTLVLFLGISFTNNVDANSSLSTAKLAQIENTVNKMGINQLNSRMLELQDEKEILEEEQGSTQSPSANKRIVDRLAEINAELSAIQKALVALVGVGAISALTR